MVHIKKEPFWVPSFLLVSRSILTLVKRKTLIPEAENKKQEVRSWKLVGSWKLVRSWKLLGIQKFNNKNYAKSLCTNVTCGTMEVNQSKQKNEGGG